METYAAAKVLTLCGSLLIWDVGGYNVRKGVRPAFAEKKLSAPGTRPALPSRNQTFSYVPNAVFMRAGSPVSTRLNTSSPT